MRKAKASLQLSLLAAAATVLAAGCGYSLVTTGNVPADVASIRVQPVEVGDGDPLLADALARELRSKIRRMRRFRVVEEGGHADAVLKVAVVTDRSRAVAFDEYDSVLDYQMTMAADARLERSNGSLLWSAEKLSSSRGHAAVASAVVTSSSAFQGGDNLEVDALPVFDDVQLGEQRREAARERLVRDLASAIYTRMTEGF